MKRNRFLLWILVLLLIVGSVSGCSRYDLSDLFAGNDDKKSMISEVRTGILRQGLSGPYKASDSNHTFAWFFADIGGLPMLFRMDSDGDTLEPLCPLSGCSHTDRSCGASYPGSGSISLYNDVLYVAAGEKLYQVNPDTGDRILMLDVRDVYGSDYTGIAEPKLLYGVYTFYLTTIDPKPEEKFELQYFYAPNLSADGPFYFKLDGTMDKPERMDGTGVPQYNDGYTAITRGQHGNPDSWILCSWDVEENHSRQLAPVGEIMSSLYTSRDNVADKRNGAEYTNNNILDTTDVGYWGEYQAFYLEQERDKGKALNTYVCKYDYYSGQIERMLSTGLEGTYRLSCFPDCFVLVEVVTKNWQRPIAPKMYIYNWEMELMGTCELDFLPALQAQYLLCGETEDRIYLAAHFNGAPEYYIEKSELKGGSVTYHPLNYTNINPIEIYHALIEKNNAISLIEAQDGLQLREFLDSWE